MWLWNDWTCYITLRTIYILTFYHTSRPPVSSQSAVALQWVRMRSTQQHCLIILRCFNFRNLVGCAVGCWSSHHSQSRDFCQNWKVSWFFCLLNTVWVWMGLKLNRLTSDQWPYYCIVMVWRIELIVMKQKTRNNSMHKRIKLTVNILGRLVHQLHT